MSLIHCLPNFLVLPYKYRRDRVTKNKNTIKKMNSPRAIFVSEIPTVGITSIEMKLVILFSPSICGIGSHTCDGYYVTSYSERTGGCSEVRLQILPAPESHLTCLTGTSTNRSEGRKFTHNYKN